LSATCYKREGKESAVRVEREVRFEALAYLVTLVVVRLHDLSEASLSDDFEDLVPVGQVVVRYVRVRALLVVVAAIVGRPDNARPLLRVGTDEVDLRVAEDLVVLVGRQLVHVELHHLLRRGHHRLRLEAARPVGGRVVGGGRRAGRRRDAVGLLQVEGTLRGRPRRAVRGGGARVVEAVRVGRGGVPDEGKRLRAVEVEDAARRAPVSVGDPVGSRDGGARGVQGVEGVHGVRVDADAGGGVLNGAVGAVGRSGVVTVVVRRGAAEKLGSRGRRRRLERRKVVGRAAGQTGVRIEDADAAGLGGRVRRGASAAAAVGNAVNVCQQGPNERHMKD